MLSHLQKFDDLEKYLRYLGRLSLYTRTRMDYEQTISQLTPEQEQAVSDVKLKKDYLIKGGAGTGKSLVLIECLRRAIMQDEFDFGSASTTTAGVTTTSSGHIISTTRLTGATTLDATHHHVFGDTDGGAFTITLPAGVDGTQYRVANVGTSGNNLTLAPDGAELLVGANANFDILDGETLDLTYETTEGWIV